METKTNIQSRRSVLLFKVVVVGQGGVGKTSLARRFCEGSSLLVISRPLA